MPGISKVQTLECEAFLAKCQPFQDAHGRGVAGENVGPEAVSAQALEAESNQRARSFRA
jgi:hypothetical protein